jgi:hypothetical protein
MVRFSWTGAPTSLHSHQLNTEPRPCRADVHLEVRRRLVNSLLERLRLRLRELGRPLREGPSSDGGRHSSRAGTGDAPQRRTEIEPTSRRQASDRTGAGEEARLPAQQPPPPKSTRLKAAVFSKKRQPGPQRQAGTIWGPTSFLDVGTGAAGDGRADQSPLNLLEASSASAIPGSSTDLPSWPLREPEPSEYPFAISADPAADLLSSRLLVGQGDSSFGVRAAAPLTGAPQIASAPNELRPLLDGRFSGLGVNDEAQ